MRIGIDLGGTKMETAFLDQKGSFAYRYRIPTPSDSYEKLLQAMAEQISRCEEKIGHQVFKAGICIPGTPVGDSGLIKNANLQILNGKPLQSDLEKLSNKSISLINDANSLAWSEYVDGVAADATSCFGVIIGTGVGGGVVINDRVITGINSVAGEWGHNPLPDYDEKKDGSAEVCYCGRKHCIENFLSGTAFAKRYNQQYDVDLTSKDIMVLFRKGDKLAQLHFQLYCDQLARALGTVINLFDPEMIILGGGMSNIDEIYPKVQKLLSKYIFSTDSVLSTKLVKAKHGDSSGVRGAAWL